MGGMRTRRRKMVGAPGGGGAGGRRRRARLRDAPAAAQRTADDRCALLDPRAPQGRRRTSCSSRSTRRANRNSNARICRRARRSPAATTRAVIDNLRRAGARAIALDIEFTQQSPNPQEDNELIEAVAPRPRESRARDGERRSPTAQRRSSAAERCCAKSARGRRRSGSRSTPTAPCGASNASTTTSAASRWSRPK